MVSWILVVLHPEIQGPDHPPLHSDPFGSVPEVPHPMLLFPHCYNLEGEENLTNIQIKDILASKLSKVMGAVLLHVT